MIILAAIVQARESLTLTLDPRVGYEPLTVTITLVLDVPAAVDELCLQWTNVHPRGSSAGSDGVSCWPARDYRWHVRRMIFPAGHFDLVGAGRINGAIVRQSRLQTLEVLESR